MAIQCTHLDQIRDVDPRTPAGCVDQLLMELAPQAQ
jgi:hypothetical protein